MDDPVAGFSPVSLEELDRRAALLRRTDRKYVVEQETYVELLEQLQPDHEVLEIDGRREFRYESMYFDTPDLRCFREHVEDVVPRFKARTRFYADTGVCVFEVKLKLANDETDKRQMDYSPEDRDRLTPDAVTFLNRALEEARVPPVARLAASLNTNFRRITVAHRESAERLTCDSGVTLSRGDSAVHLKGGLKILETKSADGDSPADRILARLGVDEVPLSKYRTGIALLAGVDGGAAGAERFFDPA